MTRSTFGPTTRTAAVLVCLTAALPACIYPVREVTFDNTGQLQFYVYDDPDAVGDYIVLTDATVWVRDESGEALDVASADSNGLWVVDVQPGQTIDLGVHTEGRLRTVRRARAPETVAQVRAPIYPRSADILPVLMDELAAVEGLSLPTSAELLAGRAGALVIEPLSPDGWTDAAISIVDSTGSDVPFATLTVLDDGSYALAEGTPVDILIASQILPGTVTLDVEDTRGMSTTQTWTLAAGELIDGRALALAGAY